MKTEIIILLRDSNGDPNRELKTDKICALTENHLSANMRAAEESRLVLGADGQWTKNPHRSRCQPQTDKLKHAGRSGLVHPILKR